jgi:GNAT superfamily N-acetyltransferase
MKKQQAKNLNLEFHPVTPKRWADFETLFGAKGACGGCWCMLWRLTRKEFEQQKGEANRQAMKTIVESGKIPGLLAYSEKQPVAWCSVAPRENFPALERSRVLKKIDDERVWSISCFFIHKDYRKKGLSVRLLEAAVDYVKKQGGRIVEGYPVEPKKGKTADVFAWTGLASFFKKAGFVECARRSETRPIMRYYLDCRPKVTPK